MDSGHHLPIWSKRGRGRGPHPCPSLWCALGLSHLLHFRPLPHLDTQESGNEFFVVSSCVPSPETILLKKGSLVLGSNDRSQHSSALPVCPGADGSGGKKSAGGDELMQETVTQSLPSLLGSSWGSLVLIVFLVSQGKVSFELNYHWAIFRLSVWYRRLLRGSFFKRGKSKCWLPGMIQLILCAACWSSPALRERLCSPVGQEQVHTAAPASDKISLKPCSSEARQGHCPISSKHRPKYVSCTTYTHRASLTNSLPLTPTNRRMLLLYHFMILVISSLLTVNNIYWDTQS